MHGGDWIVSEDGLSRNGTWVNGEKLLRRRHVLRVGATHVRFRLPLRVDHGGEAAPGGGAASCCGGRCVSFTRPLSRQYLAARPYEASIARCG